MGNNSSGSAIRGSRDTLNDVDNEGKGSHRKRSVDDAKGSSRSAAQPPDNNDDDDTAYDLPYEQPSKDADSPKGDVAASSSSGPRKGSVPATVSFAGAAALVAGAAAAAKAAGQRRGSDADQSGRGSGEPTAVEHRRNIFKKSKKKPGDSGTKSHDRNASQSDSTVGDAAGTVDPAAALPITSPAGGKVKPPTRPDLARLGSKEESSASSSTTTPSSKSGSGASAAAIASRTHVPPAPLSPPPRLPVVRNTSADGGASTALSSAIASSGITSGRCDGAQIDDDENDGDDTYDRIQRDVRPSKVKAAAARQRGGGSGEFDVAVPDRGHGGSDTYEEVHPVSPLQRQPPPVAPSASSIAASVSNSIAAQQMGRPPPLVPPALKEDDDEDGEGSYDIIQRDVNPAKAKQKRLQQQQRQQQQPTGPSSIVDREGDGRSVESDGEDDYGADTYDVIQRDVNPLKAKQQQQLLQRAQSADGRVADGGDGGAKPRRAATSDTYTDYSLPQAFEPSACAGDGRGGMAEPARAVAAPPRSQHLRSNNGSGEPVPAAATDGGGDDDGGEYECIRENFVVDTARPSVKGARPRWSEGGDSSDAGYIAIGVIGSSGSAQQGASSATSTASAAAVAATDASTAANATKATSHGDDARTRATASAAAPPNSAAAPARMLYSEVRAVVQRPGAAAAAVAVVPSAAAAASTGRLPPLPPAKQFSTSIEDDAYCTIAPSHDAGASSRALDGGRLSSGLQQTTATTAPETSGEQRKLRANVTPHCYENVDVLPSPQQQQLGARDAPPTDSEANFESSSAFYANDQSLRGSPQPPALTASPPLPRSGGVRSRDAEAQRPRPAATAQGTGSPPQPLIPPSPCKPQLKAKPVGSPLGAEIDFAMSTSAGHPAQQQQPLFKAKPVGGVLYAEIDLAVGTPAGHPAQQHQQQHPGQHPHSTQDGLFKYGSTPTVGSPAPSIPLSPPRQRPWVPRREPRYEDVDDVRGGAAS